MKRLILLLLVILAMYITIGKIILSENEAQVQVISRMRGKLTESYYLKINPEYQQTQRVMIQETEHTKRFFEGEHTEQQRNLYMVIVAAFLLIWPCLLILALNRGKATSSS